MKKLTLLLGSTALMGLGAFAYAQSSNSLADPWVSQLESEGYTDIEVETEDGEIEIEGVKHGQEREITLDEATGEVLSDELEAEDQDGEDEEDDD